jgi:hypothetical protein
MERLEVSHDGSGHLLVVFLGEGWHLILYPTLDHQSHMRAANLKLQKAGGVFAPICILTMAVSTALKERNPTFSCQVFSSERCISNVCPGSDLSPIDRAAHERRHQHAD